MPPKTRKQPIYEVEVAVRRKFSEHNDFFAIQDEISKEVGGLRKFEITAGFGERDWIVIEGSQKAIVNGLRWLRRNGHISPGSMSTSMLELQHYVDKGFTVDS